MAVAGWRLAVLAAVILGAGALPAPALAAGRDCEATVLVYHRFAATATDSTTVRNSRFEAQLRYLRDNGYPIVPLRDVVDCRQGRGPGLPGRAVAITADDGHRSIYTEMLPLVARYRVPVTLFIYPSAISNASYALTWAQLRELLASGWFDVQSHTYWHPNFKTEKRRLDDTAYRTLIRTQLERSRRVLEEKLGVSPDMIAWPFGYRDDELIAEARAQGFVAGFTLEGRAISPDDDPLALPRHMIVDAVGPGAFARLLEHHAGDRPRP